MQRTPVDSSAVASAGYEPQWRLLEIEYKPKGVYDYFDVPFEVYLGLLNAESAGEFVNTQIKPFYRFEKVN